MSRLAALGALLLLPGCSTVDYYAQAVGGHLEIMRLAVPIEDRLRDPDTPGSLRLKLGRVIAIREFASRELALPDNGSYRSYAELRRPFVLWNVFATPELSVKPLESCFLFAGCVSYRGFYSEERAERYAADLAKQGYDVHVGGVPAYSTLGWFDDPVLSTFVHYPEPDLARILFHELAHQTVYVKDDTMFNESFATAVEEEGVHRWLVREGTPEQRAAQADLRRRRSELVALFSKYRSSLAGVYAGSLPAEEMRSEKRGLLAQMLEDYRALKASWGGYAGFDRLFSRGANNALLASLASYTELVPAFRTLLGHKGGDLAAFYAAVRRLADLDKPERDAALAALLKDSAAKEAPSDSSRQQGRDFPS
jgi:predicted aminopeptidase